MAQKEEIRKRVLPRKRIVTNCAANSKTAKIINGLLKSKMHSKKPWEIYSNLYYIECVHKEVLAGTPIADISKKIQEIFESESPELQKEIHLLNEVQKEAGNGHKKHCKASEELTDDESDEASDDGGLETDPVVHQW